MVKPVYALVGDSAFLQLQKLAEIRAQLPRNTQVMDVDGQQAELADVLDELRSFAMFAAAKLLIVRNADEFISRYRQPLETYIENPGNSGTLALRCESLPKNQRIYRLIEKVGQIFECVSPKESQLPRWIISHARSSHNLTIDWQAANLLAELLGNDLGRIDNELAKLAISAAGKRITAEQVSGSVAFQPIQEMWRLTDALTAGQPTEAIRRWRQLVLTDPSTEFRAVTWLTIWLEKVARAAAMKQAGAKVSDICRELRIWPTQQVESLLAIADRLGQAGIARAYDLLAELDRRTKSGLGNAATNVERFILALAQT